MKPEPIVIERTYKAPVERVWTALTDRDQMQQWYFNIPEFRAEPGFRFSFEGGAEDRVYLHLCTVKEVIPFQKLQYSWRYEGYPGDSLVTFELFEEGAETRVRLTHEGLETFSGLNPDFVPSNFVQGWTEIVGRLLKEYTERNQETMAS